MKRIHIAMLGETIENVVRGIIAIGGAELYPITSEECQGSLDNIRKKLPWIEIHTCAWTEGPELIVNPFTKTSYDRIIELIIDIVQNRKRRESEVEFWVNITGGTNLMSAAASAGAILTTSTAYYVLKETPDPIVLPWHSLAPKDLHPIKQAILRHLMKRDMYGPALCDVLSDKKQNNGRLLDVNGRILTHHLKALEKMDYIHRTEEGRTKLNALTSWGKIAAKLIEKKR